MPKWLQQMILPTLMLWCCTVAFGFATAIGPAGIPERAELASSVALSLVIASWVVADARKRGRQLCYDFDSFLYFAWPIVGPVYLFQTRGFLAFLTLLWFAGILLVAALTAGMVLLIRGLAS